MGFENQEFIENQSMDNDIKVLENNSYIKPKILLVDDNEMNRKIVLSMLESKNYESDIALNGLEAINATIEKKYDIILMDCQMPVMDGYESTAKIRSMENPKERAFIIAMTANAMQGDREKCIKAGMDEYISKPIDFDLFFKIIEKRMKTNDKNANKNYKLIDENIDVFIKYTGLSKSIAKELYMDYMEYLNNALHNIKGYIDKKNFEEVDDLAHQLKGSSGNLRIQSIYELAIKLQNAAKEKNIEKCLSTYKIIISLNN